MPERCGPDSPSAGKILRRLSLMAGLSFACGAAHPVSAAPALPLQQLQKDFLDWRYGMFIHFNMGTFTDEEWAKPNQNPALFAPKTVDAAQWAAAAKAGGIKFAVLTTKHHDGFALWPTKFQKKNTFGTYQNVMYSRIRTSGFRFQSRNGVLELQGLDPALPAAFRILSLDGEVMQEGVLASGRRASIPVAAKGWGWKLLEVCPKGGAPALETFFLP